MCHVPDVIQTQAIGVCFALFYRDKHEFTTHVGCQDEKLLLPLRQISTTNIKKGFL